LSDIIIIIITKHKTFTDIFVPVVDKTVVQFFFHSLWVRG